MDPTLVLIVLAYLSIVNSTSIKTWDLNNNSEDSNITDSVINSKVTKGAISGLSINKYAPADDQISEISDIFHLKTIWMSGIGQNIIVTFINLPNLQEVDLSKNELVYISSKMFSFTPAQKLWLYDGEIEVIEKGSFGENVTGMHLSCNRLKRFKKEWFKEPSRLVNLELHGNLIEEIEENQFKMFTSLEMITLYLNRLHRIGDGAFAGRNSFTHILLGYNQLREIKSSVFRPGNITIDFFNINFNNLTYLSKDLLSRVFTSYTPLIDANPWQCACYYNKIIKWVNWRTYNAGHWSPPDRDGEPRCIASIGSFKNECVEHVSEDLIEHFSRNLSPPPNTKESYCSCVKRKNYQECFKNE